MLARKAVRYRMNRSLTFSLYFSIQAHCTWKRKLSLKANEHHGTKLTNAATQVYCRKPWRLSALFHYHVTPFEKKKSNKNFEIRNLHAEKISHSSIRILFSSQVQAPWYPNPDLCDTGAARL